MDNQTPQEPKTYVCLGSCQAVISEEEYKNGLTECGAESCTLKGQPLVEGHKSETTGETVPEHPNE
jgi:hypothetical protein